MKRLLYTSILLFLSILIYGQSSGPIFCGSPSNDKVQCFHDDSRLDMIDRVREKFPVTVQRSNTVAEPFLFWPVSYQPTPENSADQGYYGISGFLDSNINYPDLTSDWQCGTRTYDTAYGYNHTGVDISIWPFPWNKVNNNEVLVVAAADGFIVDKADGNYDRNCGSLNPNTTPVNSITIRHVNGYHSIYLHLKRGSVSSKQVGDPVVAGEVLGVVGSSGVSTGPHLHFEVWNELFQVVDPFFDEDFASCNSTTTNSLWLDQEPYYKPHINKLMTTTAIPAVGDCDDRDSGEETLGKNLFDFGEEFYCMLFLRDQQENDIIRFRLIDPNGSIFYQHNLSCANTPGACFYYSQSYWAYPFTIPASQPCGSWTFEVDFGGEKDSHSFFIGGDLEIAGIEGDLQAEPGIEASYSITEPDADASYFWNAYTGEVIEGQYTSEAKVLWENQESGSICALKILNNGCRSMAFCEEVFLGSSSTEDHKTEPVLLFPNPVSQYLYLNSQLVTTLSIIDLKGRTVLSTNPELSRIDLSHLSTGTYLVKVFLSNGLIESKKIVKL